MFPRYLTVLFAVSLLASAALAAEAAAPADRELSPRGRAILAYFQQLSESPDLQLVSGQFCGWSGIAKLDELAQIHDATGQWPAMIGLDYCRFKQGEATIDSQPPNKLALAYWSDGGLVTISWHAPNPAKPDGGGLKETGMKIADLLSPGPTHDRWIKSLDQVAAGLQELQAAGVVVIWRPFHEMNGGWFWWGAQEPADFIAAWRHMFDYFTHTKKLHNLIWSYGPNHGERSAEYYAGDAYVDLVGVDAYTDHINPEHIRGYPEVAALNKPFGFTEYGPHGASNPPGDYDYRQLLAGIEKNFPRTRHFLAWNEKWNPAKNKFAKEFYNDPRVITRATLPAGLAGPEDYPASIAKWRAGRLSRLTKPDGWLALIGRHPVEPGTWSVGSGADNAIRLAAGPALLGTVTSAADGKVSFALADGVEAAIDGTPARSAELDYKGDKPTYVRAGTVNFYVMDRSGKLFLRVRDSASARLKNFAGLESYPVDPAWRIEATWVPFEPAREIKITNIIGLIEPATIPGKAVFTHEGKTYELIPIDEGPEEDLFFVLSDKTAGTETYEACRFLYAQRPVDGKIILDFNKVYNPPCAFTPFATCPLPPKENLLPFLLRVGEKKYQGPH